MGVRSCLLPLVVLVVAWSGVCQGHGRFIEPPSRASAWRYGFNTPPDYDDNGWNCGNVTRQFDLNGGKCGLCGDPWDTPTPRVHEAGGKYGTGTIVRRYTVGQVIDVKVEITANHLGSFVFKICPNNNTKVEATQKCLDAYPLYLADGSGYNYTIGSANGIYALKLKLPPGLTCTQCVIQWRYRAANSWGICPDGSGKVGCGNQEEFRGCADVAISTTRPEITTQSTSSRPEITTQSTSSTTTSSGGGSGSCHAVAPWLGDKDMDVWCETNCKHVPPYCPATHCACN